MIGQLLLYLVQQWPTRHGQGRAHPYRDIWENQSVRAEGPASTTGLWCNINTRRGHDPLKVGRPLTVQKEWSLMTLVLQFPKTVASLELNICKSFF